MARFLETSQGVATRQKGFFPLKSAITALWLPSVVGDHKCVFLSTVISTLVTKIFFLILAIALAFLGQQQSVFRHPIILWCEDKWSPESLAGNITLCSFESTSTKLTSCFEISSTSAVGCSRNFECVDQRRTNSFCESASSSLLWCIHTTPVVHRSAIFTLVNSIEKEAIVEEMIEGALESS